MTTDAVEPMSYPKRQPAMEANAKARRTLDLASRFQRTTGSEERGPGLVRGILSDASSVAPPLPARRTLAAMETKAVTCVSNADTKRGIDEPVQEKRVRGQKWYKHRVRRYFEERNKTKAPGELLPWLNAMFAPIHQPYDDVVGRKRT